MTISERRRSAAGEAAALVAAALAAVKLLVAVVLARLAHESYLMAARAAGRPCTAASHEGHINRLSRTCCGSANRYA